MKKILRTFFIGILCLQVVGTAFATPVLTDIVGHKYQTSIQYLLTKGVIGGYPDGTFKPDNQINRAELLKILVGGAGFTNPDATKYKNCFPDVKEEWYAKYVCLAKEKGWVGGYPDGTFKPEQFTKKVEAMKMLMNAEGFPIVEKATGNSIYSDVNFSEWYGPYMFMAEAMKIVDIAGAKYGASDFVTRGEISNNIYRTMLILDQQVGSFDKVVLNPVVNNLFDAPVLTATSADSSSILLNWTKPLNAMGSTVKSYVLEYKLDSDVDYGTVLNYSVADYDAMLVKDGGLIFSSKPLTKYNFRVKAMNSDGELSPYSNVATITTAKTLTFDAPVLTATSADSSSILLNWTKPLNAMGSTVKSYVLEYKLDSDVDYGTVLNYSVADYDAMLVKDGGLIFSSKPLTKYNFRVKAMNSDGELSSYSNVATITTAQQLVPDAPTVEVVSKTFSTITLKVTLPKYTGDSSLDSVFSSFTNPNDGTGDNGFVNVDSNFIVNNTWTVPYNIFPDKNKVNQPTYEFYFWVNNKNGKVSEKTKFMVAGLSANPDSPAVTLKAAAKNNLQLDVASAYSGSSPLSFYFYSLDASSNPNDNFVDAGSYSKAYFENDLKGILTIGNMLSPNTTYTVSVWLKNLDGKISAKTTRQFTTTAN